MELENEIEEKTMSQLSRNEKKSLEEANVLLDQALNLIQEIYDKKSEKFDGMSNKRQETTEGQELEDLIGTIDNALSYIQSAIDHLPSYLD